MERSRACVSRSNRFEPVRLSRAMTALAEKIGNFSGDVGRRVCGVSRRPDVHRHVVPRASSRAWHLLHAAAAGRPPHRSGDGGRRGLVDCASARSRMRRGRFPGTSRPAYPRNAGPVRTARSCSKTSRSASAVTRSTRSRPGSRKWRSTPCFCRRARECGRRLPNVVTVCDSLLNRASHELFDLVIGNPPYRRVRLDASDTHGDSIAACSATRICTACSPMLRSAIRSRAVLSRTSRRRAFSQENTTRSCAPS